MDRVLCGLETEYGLAIEGRGPETQIEDALEFVSCCPIPGFLGWDNRFESPRADMRGFSVAHLAVDPEDAKFDRPGRSTTDSNLRSDRVLVTGGRFYNDHGHPEYATPECWDPMALAQADAYGDELVTLTAERYAQKHKRAATLYKNNTDFHGASYGSHESYLVPRSIPFDQMVNAVLPVLCARVVLCGAGKVGAESGEPVTFQFSQRADFFSEAINVETLFRRPVFNTRDEAHADPASWRRLHLIATDANRLKSAIEHKVELIQCVVQLCALGAAPQWVLIDPVRSYQSISRDTVRRDFEIECEGSKKTSAYDVLEALLEASAKHLSLSSVRAARHQKIRDLLEAIRTHNEWEVLSDVEWAAKRAGIEMYREANELEWGDPALQAADLSFSDLTNSDSLFDIMVEEGLISPPDPADVPSATDPRSFTRAKARALAIQKFPDQLHNVCWRRLTFQDQELELRPEIEYPETLEDAQTVEQFVEIVKNAK